MTIDRSITPDSTRRNCILLDVPFDRGIIIRYKYTQALLVSSLRVNTRRLMAKMPLKTGFIIMTPDADPSRDRTKIKTSSLELTTVAVSLFDFDTAVKVCRELVLKQGVQALILCAFFSNKEVGRVAEAVGDMVPVFVARGDVHSAIAMSAFYAKEGWFLDRK